MISREIDDGTSAGDRRLIVADIADHGPLFKALRGVDAVMHFAAFIEAGESMKFPAKYFRNNTANALTLLDAMTTHKVPRFVFSSTAASATRATA